MKIYVLTLFPEMINQALSYSIIGRAVQNGIIEIECVNFRDFSQDKHKHVDDYAYGGGVGMVLRPEPIYDAYKSITAEAPARVIYVTPQGKKFNQAIAHELAEEKSFIILCGHYEGVDERVLEEIVTDEISIGDFVLTGGEIAALAIIDSVSRLVKGVLPKEEAWQNETFSDGLLEHPLYTRPPIFRGRAVPEVLISGHHKNIEQWKQQQALERTKKKRPDLLQ